MNQTLGAYFKELRASALRFPPLDRATVEAMDEATLRAELGRRLWGLPSGARQGRRSTPAAYVRHFLTRQQAQRCPTMRDIGKRAGLDPAVIWKIEHDKPVWAENLKAALVDGLGYRGDSAEVRQCLALWMATQTQVKVDDEFKQAIGDAQQSATFNQFLERLVSVAAGIAPAAYDAVLEALSNPATVESLTALNKLAAAAQEPKLRVVPEAKA